MNEEKSVEVIQADCEAAADLIEAYWSGDPSPSGDTMRRLAESYRHGHTQGVWAQAFARHRLRSTTPPAEDAVEAVARALCIVFDKQERADGRNGGALVAYNAASFAVPFWDEMARAAISAYERTRGVGIKRLVEAATKAAERHRAMGMPCDRQFADDLESALSSLKESGR